jgi:hypothetical protein
LRQEVEQQHSVIAELSEELAALKLDFLKQLEASLAEASVLKSGSLRVGSGQWRPEIRK